MSNIITMENIKSKQRNSIKWHDITYQKDGTPVPQKTWYNVQAVLEYRGVRVVKNEITHEIDFLGLNGCSSRNGQLEEIRTMLIQEGLNLDAGTVLSTINRIAEEYTYNPFVEMCEKNENTDYDIIDRLFEFLPIDPEKKKDEDLMRILFQTWLVNVVKLAHNTLEKQYRTNGMLILLGGQGARKSTFFSRLVPIKNLFKGDMGLDKEKDSKIQNTKYLMVEWGEIDGTMKSEQTAMLKQFITATSDEYRAPYARVSEVYPRRTSFCGTVNKPDFLKDETGSRRYWVIPLNPDKNIKINIEKMEEEIDFEKLWGAVYSMWKHGIAKDYLPPELEERHKEFNAQFNFQTDTTIVLDEKLDWESDESTWEVYSLTEISNYLFIKEKKQLKQELEKRGLEYKAYRLRTGRLKRGFKIPRIDVRIS